MDSTLQVTAEELTTLGQAVQELIAPLPQGAPRDPAAGTRPVFAVHPRPSQLTHPPVAPRGPRRAPLAAARDLSRGRCVGTRQIPR